MRPVSGEGDRKSRRQGCLGRRMDPGTWLSPQMSAPLALLGGARLLSPLFRSLQEGDPQGPKRVPRLIQD